MMEESSYKQKVYTSPYRTWPKSARGRLLLSSAAILLLAMIVFLGILMLICLFVIKCGFFSSILY